MIRACVLALVCLAGVARADRLGFDPKTVYKVPRGTAPIDGPADAPITIVAWSDHACGFCLRVQPTLDALVRLYPGLIRFVHRTLPLDDEFTLAAEATLAAAAQGKLRPMSDRIYAAGGRLERAALELLARQLGLDMLRFRADLDGHVHRAQIAADIADAAALGVTGTPTFFINGRPVHGNQPLKVFADLVDEELARARAALAGYETLVGQGVAFADSRDEMPPPFALDPARVYRVGLGLAGHQRGPDTAPVTIVAWGDFQCPFCAKLAPVLAHVRQKYGDRVRVVFRHLAMSSHRQASLAAEAAIAAADQGKFWAFHDLVYGQLGQLARSDLERFAVEAKLDLPRFRAALDDRRYRELVLAEGAAAEALGVDGTPTLFVNGAPVIGSRDAAGLDQIIDKHLALTAQAVGRGIAAGDLYALLMVDAVGEDRSDPSRIPTVRMTRVALRAEDRVRALAAACRRRDVSRARELADGLTGDPRRRAMLVCSAGGIDLTPH
ncbi:MAG: thioredoxin domain-containing protein [Kofleriaceae bacterium]